MPRGMGGCVGGFVAVTVGVKVGVGVPPKGPEGRGHAYAPRERVKAASVVKPRSIERSQIITLGIPVLNFAHAGFATVMSFVKYKPQSLPAKTCCGKLG